MTSRHSCRVSPVESRWDFVSKYPLSTASVDFILVCFFHAFMIYNTYIEFQAWANDSAHLYSPQLVTVFFPILTMYRDRFLFGVDMCTWLCVPAIWKTWGFIILISVVEPWTSTRSYVVSSKAFQQMICPSCFYESQSNDLPQAVKLSSWCRLPFFRNLSELHEWGNALVHLALFRCCYCCCCCYCDNKWMIILSFVTITPSKTSPFPDAVLSGIVNLPWTHLIKPQHLSSNRSFLNVKSHKRRKASQVTRDKSKACESNRPIPEKRHHEGAFWRKSSINAHKP